MASTGADQALRRLPSIEALLGELEGLPRPLALAAAREEVASLRRRLLAGEAVELEQGEVVAATRDRARAMARPSLRRVLNATGVILHTNLGRAPLADAAIEAAAEASRGYSNLELDLATGERGSRHDHVEEALRRLTGAAAAIAVNNNAAAVLLALAATAAGRQVLIGRGQLIEIGGSFRIPEILACSGAKLVEVGTTNRTNAGDYAAAIGPGSAAIMRVHQSNFRSLGFVAEPGLAELAALASERGLTLIDDLGSGLLSAASATEASASEPSVRASVEAGADLVCASADKLLGGPQAGLIVGSAEAVERCRRHPLARALRLDKLQLAALEPTLGLHERGRAGELPAVRMLRAEEPELRGRAERIASAVGPAARLGSGAARPGGGTLPLTELPGPVCLIDPGPGGADALAARLREAEPPLVCRISEGELVVDPRTLSDEDADLAAAALRAALAASPPR